MKILAIDSSSVAISAALMEDKNLLGETYVNTGLKHSKAIIPMVNFLLKSTEVDITEIDYFAVSNGPGSFTGLRIGIAAIKGIATVVKKPCIPISSLFALASSLSFLKAKICCVMDAKCNQVYTAFFESTGSNIIRKTEDRATSLEELIATLDKQEGEIFLVGDGASLCYNKVKRGFSAVTENLSFQRAYGVAKAAELLLKQGFLPLMAKDLNPVYLSLPQAQRELKRKTEKGEDQQCKSL